MLLKLLQRADHPFHDGRFSTLYRVDAIEARPRGGF